MRILKSKLVWIVLILAALVGVYALLGYKLAPRLIRSKAIEFVRQEYGRDLKIGAVEVDPFRLTVDIRDVMLPDADKALLLGFRRLFLDFELSSLWKRTYTFKEVLLEQPAVRAVIRTDGSVNLGDLKRKQSAAPDSQLPPLWIQSLRVSDGKAEYHDLARRVPFHRRLEPLHFNLNDFRTSPQGGDFMLSARTDQNEQFEWQGNFTLNPGVASKGRFAVTDLRALGIAEYLGDTLPFQLTSGEIDLAGQYTLQAGKVLTLALELPAADLSGLSLRARGTDTDWVTIPDIKLTGTRVLLPQHEAEIAAITLTGLKASLWRDRDGSFNVTRLFAAPQQRGVAPKPAAPRAPPADPPAATKSDTTKAGDWKFSLGQFDLRKGSVVFEDRAVQPTARFVLAPLDVDIDGLSLSLNKPLPISIDSRINGSARFDADGKITPSPLAADLKIALDGFDLRQLQPYIAGATDLTVGRGSLGLAGQFALNPPASKAPEVAFTGDVSVRDFKSVDNALRQDFFNFKRMELGRTRYTAAPDALTIDRVRLLEPYNSVIISSDQVLNIAAVFDPKGTAQAVAARKAAAAAQGNKSKPVKKTRAQLRAEKAAAKARAKALAKQAAAPQPELKETGMPVRVRELQVINGRMNFEDFSVQPNFAADIERLNGSINGISTDPNHRAQMTLKGRVSEFSPVTIAGELQPFAFERYTDIGMRFENISLPIFNPYSGKYSGYNIAQGKLTTDLRYLVRNRKLDARHHIRIDQLEWGEATAEKQAATLPVKLATALLKDADGVIELDIPVTGTIDDPKFRMGPIIWQVVRNVLKKAVTAPFRAIGRLFKGGEESQFIDFAAGATTLDPAAAERLTSLGKAISGRKELRIKIPIGAIAELDQPAPDMTQYNTDLAAAIQSVVKTKQGQPAATLESLEPDQQIAALTALVRKQTGTEPVIPPTTVQPSLSRKQAKASQQAATIEYLTKQSRSGIKSDPAALEKIADARAQSVQRALLTDTGLDPMRVFLTKNGKVSVQDGKVRLELTME